MDSGLSVAVGPGSIAATVLSKNEAFEIRSEIENIEKNWPDELEGLGRNYIHLISPVFDKVSHNPKILDAVESIIGRDILICGTTLFIKNPNEKGFVSFHQDAKYIGLEPHNWVTAWIAVTDANERTLQTIVKVNSSDARTSDSKHTHTKWTRS